MIGLGAAGAQLCVSTGLRGDTQPAWVFIGPQPLSIPAANFAGISLGGSFTAAGRVTAIAADPTKPGRLFVGSAGGGVWISTDGGSTFSPIFDAEPSQAIGAIALDPINATPPAIYVATGEGNGSDSYYGRGIYRSTDLGASWNALSPGIFDREAFTNLAIDTSTNPPRLFAGVTGASSSTRSGARFLESDPAKGGLWRSTDGGASWMQYPVGVFGCAVVQMNAPCPAESIAIDPLNPGQVYTGIEFDDVFVSSDGGESFAPSCFTNDSQSCGYPSGTAQMDRETVAVGPPAPGAPLACSGGTRQCGVVYAILGALGGGEYAGFFRSTDGGLTWSQAAVPEFGLASNVTIDGNMQGSMSGEDYAQTLLVSPENPAVLFFGGVGIYESTDSGGTWSFLARNGGTGAYQHALAIAPDGDAVYLGNDTGAYRFSIGEIADGAASFSSLNQTLAVALIRSLAPDPHDNRRILAALDREGAGLYAGAQAWNQVEGQDAGWMLFDRANPDFAYESLATAPGANGGDTAVGLGVSTDGGTAWLDGSADFSNADPGFAKYPPLVSDPAIAQRVLLGGHHVWIWNTALNSIAQESTQDLTGGCIDGSCALQDIEFAPSDRSRAWALSTRSASVPFRLFNTTMADRERGVTWTDVTDALPFDPAIVQPSGIATDPNSPTVAYLSVLGFTASTGIGHIFMTSDFGASWAEDDGAGGPSPLPDVPVTRVLVDLTDSSGNTLYAATESGVFHSLDRGKGWSAFELGTIPTIPGLDIEQNLDGVIFAGTHGRGVYRLYPRAPVTPTATATPAPTGGALKFSPTTINFLPIGVDTGNRTRTLLLRNSGVGMLNGSIDVSSLPPPFKAGGSVDFALARGRSRSVTVRFAPTSSGDFRGVIRIATNDPANQTATVPIHGTGLPGEIAVPPALDFGRIGVGKAERRNLTVMNKGAGVLHCAIDASHLGPAFVLEGSSMKLRVRPGNLRRIGVRFAPPSGGDFIGTLALVCDDPDENLASVILRGSGE